MWKNYSKELIVEGDCMKGKVRAGYSLIELMIAMAISAIVLTAIIGLIGFATRNMRITQTSVDLQNQAKETLNHMTTYVMEGSRVEWDDNKKRLTITKDKIGADHKPESSLASYYWQDGDAVYFAKDTETKKAVLTSDKKHLLLDHVKDFTCEKKEDKEKKQKDILFFPPEQNRKNILPVRQIYPE